MAQIKSGAGADLLTVGSNKAARVELFDGLGNSLVQQNSSFPSTLYGLPVLGSNDGRLTVLRTDRTGALASATNTPLVSDQFENSGGSANLSRWTTTSTTYTASSGNTAGFMMNSSASLGTNVGYLLRSNVTIRIAQRALLHAKIRARMVHYNNGVFEIGFGDATTATGSNTTGAYWQRLANGELRPVLTFNSVDQTGPNFSGVVNAANFYTYDIILDDDSVTYTIQNTETQQIIASHVMQLSATAVRLLSAASISVILRQYCLASAPPTAPQLIISDVYADLLDADLNIPSSHLMAINGKSGIVSPTAGTQLANHTNSAAPTNATLSNTAAGYSTLGGLFSFAAVVGAATDYALFGLQVPSGYNLIVTGVSIETFNTGAAGAATLTTFQWSIATNLSAVSLASVNHARVGLGVQQFPASIAIGAKAERIDKVFSSPVVCHSGKFIDVVLRMPVGAATASQVMQGMVNFEGYFI